MVNVIFQFVFRHIHYIHFQTHFNIGLYCVNHLLHVPTKRLIICLFPMTQSHLNGLEACLDLILVWWMSFFNLFLVISTRFTSNWILTLVCSMLLSFWMHQPKGNYFFISNDTIIFEWVISMSWPNFGMVNLIFQFVFSHIHYIHFQIHFNIDL